MTSSQSATDETTTGTVEMEPRRPDLLPPWHTPEREALQLQARAFAMDEVLPVADELDPQKGEIPQRILERLGELGYFGITVDREHGGMGLGVFEYCMVSEELARAWMSVASILARSQGMGTSVADAGRRDALLRKSAAGSWIGAVALSEPDAGSDLANVQTRAVRDGDEWVITGHKRWCGNAKAADFIQVLVRVADPQPGSPVPAGCATCCWPRSAAPSPRG
ncbi:acyl-CoA dehydrogenase family protein [Klenkia terrae]|uniref:acyl-CoA dehydrogenase family protein n=1 Tax=Klenkia terrae TaxID=1052259 RepID=UPI0036096AFD